MNEIQWLQFLDRGETAPPDIDVANSVMRTIHERERETPEPLFALAALLSLLVGGGAVAAALLFTAADPFSGFLDTFKLVLQ